MLFTSSLEEEEEEEEERRNDLKRGWSIRILFFSVIVTIGCGDTSRENSTVFESAGDEDGGCVATVCKRDENICQLR